MQNLSPIAWALCPLKNYANFSGRASRAEFWWFFLFLMIVYSVLWIALFTAVGITAAAATPTQSPLGMMGAFGVLGLLMVVFWFVLLIPVIAVQVRRLHDTNRSGWWLGVFWLLYPVYMILIFGTTLSTGPATATHGVGLAIASAIFALAFFVYSIVPFVFWCLPGTRGANRFGEDPYGANFEEVFA